MKRSSNLDVQENSRELAWHWRGTFGALWRRRWVEMEMAICIEKLFTLLLTWHMALKNHNTPQAPI